MTPESARTDSIGSRVLRGIAWKASSQVILQITRMVVALLLARLLTPHDWGLAGMVILFAGFTIVFTDNALGTALIQRRDVREEDKSTVFWFSAAVGLALAVAGVLVAAPLANFYDEPDVRWLFIAFSVGFIVNALGTTQMALLVREMQFRRLELRQMAATIVGAITAISIALARTRRLGDRRPTARRSGHLDGAAVAADPLETVVRLLDRQRQTPGRIRRQRLRAKLRLAERAKPQWNPDRTRAGRCGARDVHARDDRDPDAVRTNCRAAAAGLPAGVLGDAPRARANG